ncbi:MAG: thioredoxin domain-containing protein [Candidatus Thermoplasmatota archaeon]|nr:thioredoxin domain-containing protein [Candidatus Thermoplasmatota archaeon]
MAVAHVNEFQEMTIQTEFYVVGSNRTSSKNSNMKLKGSDRTALYVDFNITFTKMPCNYLTVDYYDVFGTRDLDINDKIKLNTFGKQDGHVSSTKAMISTSTGRHLLQIDPEDKEDPLDLMPNDGPTVIELKDLEEMAKVDGKESEIHPSAVVIKIGEEERHVVPGGGEHQLIKVDHPVRSVRARSARIFNHTPKISLQLLTRRARTQVHKKTEGKAQLLETTEQFDTFVHENDIAFVNFFAPWCHWCRQFAPVWDAASNTMRELDEPFAKRTCGVRAWCSRNSLLFH